MTIRRLNLPGLPDTGPRGYAPVVTAPAGRSVFVSWQVTTDPDMMAPVAAMVAGQVPALTGIGAAAPAAPAFKIEIEAVAVV
jgi:enamine deaminase RidA (YjgF/YER057c/UK114 family)